MPFYGTNVSSNYKRRRILIAPILHTKIPIRQSRPPRPQKVWYGYIQWNSYQNDSFDSSHFFPQLDRVKIRNKRSPRASPSTLYSSTLQSEDEEHSIPSGIHQREDAVLIHPVNDESETCDIRETVEMVIEIIFGTWMMDFNVQSCIEFRVNWLKCFLIEVQFIRE